MRILSVILKSLKEQLRHFWIFILVVSMAPFFVFVYYLIYESYQPVYQIVIVNNDSGTVFSGEKINHGNIVINLLESLKSDTSSIPIVTKAITDKKEGENRIKNKDGDIMVILPQDFSYRIKNLKEKKDTVPVLVEFSGDLTNYKYLVGAIYAGELISTYILNVSGKTKPMQLIETPVGRSAKRSDFELAVPGLLILSLIMLMFSATIAIVNEVEKKTMLRLKLSKLNALEFLTGVSVVQIFIGLIAVFLTLLAANSLGFESNGSFWILFLLASLTSISIIAFSLLLAAFTKSVNEVLIVGNFPMLLFMFFSGAMFPVNSNALFNIGGYHFTLIGLMSPSHAISAVNKVLIMGMNLSDIWPEIVSLLMISTVYFIAGIWAFNRRHMRIEG